MKKRINMDINENLWKRVGVKAAESGITKRDLVERALESHLERDQKEEKEMSGKIVYWTDKKTGAYVELAGTKWDGDLSDEELLAKAREVAEQEGMDLSYGEIVIEIEEEAN